MARNTICHFEIPATDAKKVSDFYRDLFGWKLSLDMGDDYVLFQPEDGPGGAISKVDDFAPAERVMFYVEVDDVEAYLKKAMELGGKPLVSKTEIPDVGWYGHFADPDGNTMGLFTGRPRG